MITNITKNNMKSKGGSQWLFEFDNKYKLSIVNHNFSYGWEAALFYDEEIIYDGILFEDVVGWMEPDQMLDLIYNVMNFKKDKSTDEEYDVVNNARTFNIKGNEIEITNQSDDHNVILETFMVQIINP